MSEKPFAKAWTTLQHVAADTVVLLAFILLVYLFELLLNILWPDHTDPAFFGFHLHDAMVVIKWVTIVAWMAITSWKLLRHTWQD
jgi:hypothetical protein